VTDVSAAQEGLIFINYRRIDTGWSADYLAKALEHTFGKDRVFQDVREIGAGQVFADELEEALRRSAVLLVLVGKGWLTAQDQYGRRRLDREDDWVRQEIRIGLQHQGCRVIPVLVDDAQLPREAEALPEDIAALLQRQRMQIRQANSDDDIGVLIKELETAGIQRVSNSGEAVDVEDFSDERVAGVVMQLRRLKEREGGEFVGRRELLRELDRLFNRKTFRFESLRNCPEQRWGDRLDSAYQTEKVLTDWERNAIEVAEEKYPSYVNLMKEVGNYCMQMGALLFNPPVDYDRIKSHIGKPTFKAQLPPAINFPVGDDKQPQIPDKINDPIERHRKRANMLMNKLAKE
jgi:hypothetical protein